MLTQRRQIITLAAVLTTLTMAGGVTAVEIAAHPSSAHPAIVQNAPVQAAPVASPAFGDGAEGS